MAGKNEVRVTFIGDDKSLSAKTKEVSGELGKLETSVGKGVGKALEDLQSKFGPVGSKLKGMGVDFSEVLGGAGGGGLIGAGAVGAGAAIGTFALEAVSNFQHAAQSVLHFQQIAGGTAQDASRWVQVFNEYGISADDAGNLVGKFAKNVGGAPQKLEQFGIEIAHAKDGTIDLNATLMNAIDVMHKAPDEATRAAIGAALFGKSWQSMAKVVDAGAEEVKTSFSSVNDANIFDQKQLGQSEDMRKAIHEVEQAVQGLEFTMVGDFMPVILETTQTLARLTDGINSILGPIGDVGGVVKIVFDNFSPLGQVLRATNLAMDAGSAAADGLSNAWGALTDAGPADVVAIKNNTTAVDEHGRSLQAATSRVEDQKAAQDTVKLALDASKEATKEYTDAVKRSNDALAAEKKALDDAKAALDAKEGSALAALNSELGLNQAVDGVSRALKGNAADSDAVKTALLNAAGAASQFAQDQAGASGAAFTTSDKINAQVGELQTLKEKFPQLAGPIDEFIAKLNAIPRTINTTVVVSGPSGVEVHGPGGTIARAGGGPVSAGQPYVVGEHHPELFVPNTNGTIVPSVPSGGGNSGGGGGGGNTYITAYITATDPDDMVRQLKKYERRNGYVPVKTL